MRHSEYLYRSRHGIYYFRVVMPKSLRLAHPTLPKELKASLKCSNRVHAGVNCKSHRQQEYPITNDVRSGLRLRPEWT